MHDLNAYRRAKLFVKDLTSIISVLKQFYLSLKPFKKYSSVRNILGSINSEILILECHLDEQNNILQRKARVKTENSNENT